MIGVVVSRADSASEHIGDHLRDLEAWTTETDDSRTDAEGGGTVYRTEGFELREFEEWHLHLDDVASVFESNLDLLVFASRHSGETGPLLTAHYTGNFGPADHGGEDDELARTCPNAHSEVIDALAEHAPPGYEVGMECTHHGPSDVGAPSMFVELGSAEPHWNNPQAARAVARAILDLRGVSPDAEPEDAPPSLGSGTVRRHLVGFGGGHYAPRFGRIVRETDWAVGHLAADWGLDAMGDPSANRDLLDRAFAESAAEFAIVDGDYPDLTAELIDLGYRVVGESWVQAVDGVPLGLVDRLEDALVPVEAGLRFGAPAARADPETDFETVELPEELLATVQGIDQSAARDAVVAEALAFETVENGNRVAGQAAVSSSGDYDTLIDSILPLLDRTYDTVERSEDAVVARKSAFDPGKARTLGVPEGPKFGRLTEGEPVRVNGKTIPPDRVRTEQVDRFPV
ncbi:D-aminoacyl-tRNA deacylase [Halorientalis salina]|uniref:D-aminoacyl-tRNA deacylase n=1 Tax=Halorientalis salina TaxID=2932266 RepID=UPI0010ABFBD6|nr:D-aminoacyl-tRNA deacylase [Halorientalis salina]